MKSIQSTFPMPLLLAALLAGGGILAAAAHAMPGGGPDGQPRCEARQGQNFQSRMQARHDQHMGALKEKLKLAPEQEAAWNTFAASMQPGMRQAGMGGPAAREQFQQLNTVERLDRMQAMAEARHARMIQRAEAVKAFYTQLTPEQKKVFDAEAMPMQQQRMHHRRLQS